MDILQYHKACHRMLALPVVLLLLGACSGYALTSDEQSPSGWEELMMRCRHFDDKTPSVAEEEKLPIRPVRGLGSEFLGKRTLAMEHLCAELVFSNEIDEDWLCHCVRHFSLPALSTEKPEGETIPFVNKRGLGAILLSGKRMNNNKWNNGLNRRVMGSEFLGKRAIMGSEFLGKRALGSEFLGKRAIMGSEFLGKRNANSRMNRLSSSSDIAKV